MKMPWHYPVPSLMRSLLLLWKQERDMEPMGQTANRIRVEDDLRARRGIPSIFD